MWSSFLLPFLGSFGVSFGHSLLHEQLMAAGCFQLSQGTRKEVFFPLALMIKVRFFRFIIINTYSLHTAQHYVLYNTPPLFCLSAHKEFINLNVEFSLT